MLEHCGAFWKEVCSEVLVAQHKYKRIEREISHAKSHESATIWNTVIAALKVHLG